MDGLEYFSCIGLFIVLVLIFYLVCKAVFLIIQAYLLGKDYDSYKIQRIEKGGKFYYVEIKRQPERGLFIPRFETYKEALDYINKE